MYNFILSCLKLYSLYDRGYKGVSWYLKLVLKNFIYIVKKSISFNYLLKKIT